MKRICLLVVAICVATVGLAEQKAPEVAMTNVVVSVVSTNAPAAKSSHRQCDAITKSGNRCKRNAAPGAKLCRQHQKIDAKKSK